MKQLSLNPRNLLVFSLPILIVLFAIWLVSSPLFQQSPDDLAWAITLDLILTVPFVYFLIIRKKETPKITVVSVFIVCLILASFILPEENQGFLSQIKFWAIPLAEFSILAYLFINVRKTIRQYKLQKNKSLDFYSTLRTACKNAFPSRFATAIAFEVAVFHYSFFNWKKNILKNNEHSSFKKNGIVTVIYVFIFLVLVETCAVHLLIMGWNNTLANVLTAIGLYTCLQLFALARSLAKRPSYIDEAEQKIFLRYGFFNETTINISEIQEIIPFKKSLPSDGSIVKLSPLSDLDTHNLVLHLKSEHTLYKMYGFSKKYKSIAIWLDDRDRFMEQVDTIKDIS